MPETTKSRNVFYDKHRIPVPESLKWASTRGGYTTVQAQYQMEKCTKIWGPYGQKWGLRDLHWTWIYDNESPVYVQLDCIFFWYETKEMVAGEFEMTSGWAFQTGDSDVLKKAQTDAISKALSKLGVDSDVFKGLWAQINPVDGVVYIGENPARDVPRADQKRIEYLEDDLLTLIAENKAKSFIEKLNKLNWNYMAVEVTIKKIETHLSGDNPPSPKKKK